MQTLVLPGKGRSTTRLGFGCSGILGSAGAGHSTRLLEAAYEAGIRHFDVAPMYGYGTAEVLLGSFLRHHPDTTVTTKYGLLPEHRSSTEILLRSVAKRVLSRLRPASPQRPATPQHLAPPQGAAPVTPAAVSANKAPFTAAAARASLHSSLRALQRDHIDLFLLHEATAADLVGEDLLSFLQSAVTSGEIGAFGVGAPQPFLPALLASRAPYCGVVQSDWSVCESPVPCDRRLRILYRTLQSAAALQEKLREQTSLMRGCSREIGFDLQDDAVWPGLLLQVALTVNPETLVLFSSRSAQRIQANAFAAADDRVAEGARRLHGFLMQTGCCSANRSAQSGALSVAHERSRG